MDALFILAIVQDYVKAARHRDDKLLESFVSMAAPFPSAGYIVQIVDALDVERHMISTFNKGEIPPRIRDLWKADDSAMIEASIHD